MAATNDHIPDFGDFERYHSGKMLPEEQHWLEGKMLAEPLVAESYEGFLAWRAEHTDLAGVRSALHERLHTRLARRNALPLWAYASAASVVLALLVYWSVFVRDQNAEMQQPAVKPSRISQAEAEKADASVPPTIRPADAPKASAPAPAAKDVRIETPASPETVELAANPVAEKSVREEVIDNEWANSSLARTDAAKTSPSPASTLAAPGAAQAVGKSIAARMRAEPSTLYSVAEKKDAVRKLDIKSEQLADAGLSAAETKVVAADTLAPMPAAGWTSYRQYLDKNTKSAIATGQVSVAFSVGISGELSGFTAKGPEALLGEAIRIVTNGPAWAPARTQGRPVAAKAEIQLQFRSSK
ncbi:hypothetical protein [Dyadobacter fermentans]|uniref:TonB C-terminal domain-containing protein n=1 Tax=Dyadobacter fermentans (strain ATCC 700827 / DSM 18053 / CIP 107007 / KCTC 52180 / NS114) TaxID=471854 RepID=C6VVX5_DYAFD|nr:hypothetical protein [Dyadobacter fermentans]ACT91431.1 hypothetical protein Dfer_0160 [Dyadobacter fermentans DSM 18053]